MENNTTEIKNEAKASEVAPIVEQQDDLEARIKQLEEEKAKLIETDANYKMAYLKERSRRKKVSEDDEDFDENENLDDKMRRIANEALAESRLAEIAKEQDVILKKALKENKELKLAHSNKNSAPAAMGTHSEGTPVKDNLISEAEMAAFKLRGWNDKDIERYKKNLLKYGAARI